MSGTASVIFGDKFATGARSGAYQYLYNQVFRKYFEHRNAVKAALLHAKQAYKVHLTLENIYSSLTIGIYIYATEENEFVYDFKVNPLAGAGFHPDSAPFSSYGELGCGSLVATDMVVVLHDLELFSNYRRAVDIGISNVYVYQTTQKVTYQYQYNSNSRSWSRTIFRRW